MPIARYTVHLSDSSPKLVSGAILHAQFVADETPCFLSKLGSIQPFPDFDHHFGFEYEKALHTVPLPVQVLVAAYGIPGNGCNPSRGRSLAPHTNVAVLQQKNEWLITVSAGSFCVEIVSDGDCCWGLFR